MFTTNAFADSILVNVINVSKYGPPMFSSNDFENSPLNLPWFARRLARQAFPGGEIDTVSCFIYKQLDAQAREVLGKYIASVDSVEGEYTDAYYEKISAIAKLAGVKPVLAANLNRIIHGPSIYEKDRFRGVPLSRKVKEMLKKHPATNDVLRLNYLLLTDCYPQLNQSAINASGTITGMLRKREKLTHIEIFPAKLPKESLQDIWVVLPTASRISIAEIVESMTNGTAERYSFIFDERALARLKGWGSDGTTGERIVNGSKFGSFKNNREITLPCSVQEFESVFGIADEISRRVMW